MPLIRDILEAFRSCKIAPISVLGFPAGLPL